MAISLCDPRKLDAWCLKPSKARVAALVAHCAAQRPSFFVEATDGKLDVRAAPVSARCIGHDVAKYGPTGSALILCWQGRNQCVLLFECLCKSAPEGYVQIGQRDGVSKIDKAGDTVFGNAAGDDTSEMVKVRFDID